jgi:hypothetical protein
MTWTITAAVLLAAPAAGPPPPARSAELAPPVALLASGKPIDVDVGHAAPCVADLLGEGKPQLLVGQFRDGMLRVYRNVGSERAPRFDRFEYFKAGGDAGKVPSG